MCSPVVRSRCARTSAATSWRRCFAGRSGGASRSQPDAEPPAAFQQRRAVDAGIGAAAPRTTVPGVSAAAALYSPAGRVAATGWVQSRLVLLLTWLGSHGAVGTAPLWGRFVRHGSCELAVWRSSVARPSNSTLQPTSEAVTAARRSSD